MEPKIVQLAKKTMAGKHLSTNFVENRTQELWKSFMPYRNTIPKRVSDDLYSVEFYDALYFKNFRPGNNFEKWAAVEVSEASRLPEGFDSFELIGGLYAVFLHKGRSTDTSTFHFIFSKWLPESVYVLDDRPHFEVMGKNYKNDDPDSEEEIWIPIKKKDDAISPETLDGGR